MNFTHFLLKRLGSFDWQQVFSCFWILFVIIDILGSVPIIINIKKRVGHIYPARITAVAGGLMASFLFVGPWLLNVFSIDVPSFSVAGSLILLILGLEMVLNVSFFHVDSQSTGAVSIVPLAFPVISGTGTMITLLTLKAEYAIPNILCAVLANLIFIHLVLQNLNFIANKMGQSGSTIIQKVMGIVVLSIAVKILKVNLFL